MRAYLSRTLCSNPLRSASSCGDRESLKSEANSHPYPLQVQNTSISPLSEITRERSDHCVLYDLYSDLNALIEGTQQKLPSFTFRCALSKGSCMYNTYIYNSSRALLICSKVQGGDPSSLSKLNTFSNSSLEFQ